MCTCGHAKADHGYVCGPQTGCYKCGCWGYEEEAPVQDARLEDEQAGGNAYHPVKRELTGNEEKEAALKLLRLKYHDSVRLYQQAKARMEALSLAIQELGGQV